VQQWSHHEFQMITDRDVDDFNDDKTLLSAIEQSLETKEAIRLQRSAVYLRAALALEKKGLLESAAAARVKAHVLMPDEAVERTATLNLGEGHFQSSDPLWLMNHVGVILEGRRLEKNDDTGTCIEIWNNARPDIAIEKGDRLVAVDGVYDYTCDSIPQFMHCFHQDACEATFHHCLIEPDVVARLSTLLKSAGVEGIEAAAWRIGRLLDINDHVREIKLSGQHLEEVDAKVLAQVLKNNRTVFSLFISWNSFGDAGCVALMESLAHNKTVTSLSMKHVGMGSAAGVALAKMLQLNSSIRWMELDGNNIGESGGVSIAKALENNTSLVKVRFVSCNFGDATAAALASTLETNQVLFSLKLNKNTMSSELTEKINALMVRRGGRLFL
jgi:hypothetical protein